MTQEITIPADVARERDTLGAALLSGAHARDLAQQGKSDDFSLEAHRWIFAAIGSLVEAGNDAIDFLLVGAELERRGQLQSIGGYAYISDLSILIVLGIPQSTRLKRLRELARRRRLLGIGDELARRAQDPTIDVALTHKWLAESTEVSI